MDEKIKNPVMKSIRETAKLGILTEYTLRIMAKEGKLPCIYVGKRCLINVNALIEQLNAAGGKEDA